MTESWQGWRDGHVVATYPNRSAAEAALQRRQVDATSPVIPDPPCEVVPNSDAVALWDCPCRECTHLDWEAHVLDGWRGTLTAWRKAHFPEVWA